MGRVKEDYVTMLNIRPSDTIIALKRKIAKLEEEIKQLKEKYEK